MPTVTVAGPVAAAPLIVNVVLICVGLTTFTVPTAMLLLLTETVAGARKLLPVRVTAKAVAPWMPLAGLMPVKDGTGGLTLKVWLPLVPLAVPTAMLAEPIAALGTIVSVVLI